jgi:hypothetical protein
LLSEDIQKILTSIRVHGTSTYAKETDVIEILLL